MEQLAAIRILHPVEVSMSDSDSSSISHSAESAGRALSASPSKKRGSTGAVHGSALFGSALLARVDDLVQKCLTTKAGIKDMRTRSVITPGSMLCLRTAVAAAWHWLWPYIQLCKCVHNLCTLEMTKDKTRIVKTFVKDYFMNFFH